jgi:hypothetical protein
MKIRNNAIENMIEVIYVGARYVWIRLNKLMLILNRPLDKSR